MSDREAADLAAIMSDEADYAPEPLDGAPPETVSADTPDDEEPLDVEEAVAAELRRGLEDDDGELVAEAGEGQAPTPDPNDPEVLRAMANEAMQWRQWHAVEAARSEEGAIFTAANQQIAEDRAHYERERIRLELLLDERAQEMAEPDLFKRQQLPLLHAGVDAQRDAWIARLEGQRDAQINEIREARAKPLAAQKMAAEYGLPPQAVPQLMETSTLNDMRIAAGIMAQAVARVSTGLRAADQQVRKAANQQIRMNNLHPGGSGTVRNSKPYQYSGTGSKGEQELKSIIGPM